MSLIHPNDAGCDVLVTGRYFCDVVITGLPEMPRLGHEVWGTRCEILPGASFIPAVALHRLGLRIVWPCYFGVDVFSRLVREQARIEGLNENWFLDYDQPALGLTVSLSFASERSFITYADELPEPLYPDLIRQVHPRWILLTSLMTGDNFTEIVKAARQAQTMIFMECQANNASLDDSEVRDALSSVDVFSPNQEEALRLTGTNSGEDALAVLAGLCPLNVIKLGKDGAIAQQGSKVVRIPGIQTNTVDTTGAGDNFDCGFIYAYSRGYSLEDCLLCGNICGGLSTEAYGGTRAAPDHETLEKWRRQCKKMRSTFISI
jgi:sugar/nucleoside kinase (ribokinase family)